VTLVRRDTRAKEQVGLGSAPQRIAELLREVQTALFDRAREYRDRNTHQVESFDQFKRVIAEQRGFVKAYWCGSAECEARIKEETRATIRVIPDDAEADGGGSCVLDGQPATRRALFAQAY
jgi:prolyl-tRNA synthetase